jgi:cell division protein FtsL
VRRIGIFFLVVILLAVVASSIGVIYARQQSRRLFVEYTELTKKRDELNFEFGRLELEQATAAEANRIDRIARADLGMIVPTAASTVVIKR